MPPTRAELLRVLADLCAIHREMRFGQLVCNLASLVDMSPEAIWTVGDAALLAEAKEHLERQLQRLEIAATPPMTDKVRLELLATLRDLSEHDSDDVFGRMVARLVASNRRFSSPIEWAGSIWDEEDEALLATARRYLGRPLTDDDPRARDHTGLRSTTNA